MLPHFFGLGIPNAVFAVLADCLNALSVGAPLVPGLRIFSPEPALIRSRLAWMLSYRPFMSLPFVGTFREYSPACDGMSNE